MILVSLGLVLLSLALLVVGLAGASQLLVWASILTSVAAGACLTVAAMRRRAGPSDHLELTDHPELTGHPELRTPLDAPTAGEDARGRMAVPPDLVGVTPPAGAGVPADQPPPGAAGRSHRDYPDPPDEPPIEEVSTPDALRALGVEADVHVVDGRPRYHLAGCPHLADRQVIPLPLGEAREAGFTPCARCRPDATLAGQARHAMGTRPSTTLPPARFEPPAEDHRRR